MTTWSCTNSSSLQLYCSPAWNTSVYENQNYALDYNSQFWSIKGNESVDVYLYHADNGNLAQRIPDVTNSGEMTFTIDEVRFQG